MAKSMTANASVLTPSCEHNMPYKPIPDDCFIRRLERYFYQGRHIWISDDRRFRYTWDSLHGEVEVYSRRGRHLGVLNCSCKSIGGAVKGRRIDV